MSKDRDKGKTIDIRCSHDFTGRPEKHAKSCPMYKEYPSAHGNSGGGYKGGLGGQWGYSGSNSGQTKINPQAAKQITDKISTSESAIQNEIGRLKGLNPIASEETLRSAAIQELGIATFEELLELKSYKKEQETALAVNVAQKITPYVLSLNSGEWSLGIHTASFNGRKSKDGDGISNQVKICLEHLRINGGADALRVLTFTECDLTENDMIYFGNTMLQYSLLLKYLDFSDNRISDIGTIYLFNSFITLPMGKYPMHHIINLNLSNNGIGDDGAGHIAAYIKSGYMPSLKVTHLEGNKITKTGESYLVKALLNKATQHMIVYTQSYKGQFDEHVKMIFGTKEERATVYKKLIAQGIEKGVNVEAIVVDQTSLGKINNGINLLDTNFQTFWGFMKCNFHPIDMVKSYAADKIIAKLPKSISKLMGEIKTTEDAVSCYFEAHNEAWTSESGLNVLTHELCVTGESGFCNDQ